jgi:hypothetical protein
MTVSSGESGEGLPFAFSRQRFMTEQNLRIFTIDKVFIDLRSRAGHTPNPFNSSGLGLVEKSL